MSALTPEELAILTAAKARIDTRRVQQAELDFHELERRAGRRPDVSLATWKRGVSEAAVATTRASEHLAIAVRPEVELERRREAARAAIAAVPWELERFTAMKPRKAKALISGHVASVGQRLREYFTARPTRLDYARDVDAALSSPIEGPAARMRNAGSFVQEEDLEDLVPDGWGASWPIETKRLARRAGIPPAAVPLLNLLTWCSDVRPPEPGSRRELGAGFQVSIAWLSRKLGISESWVKVLWNRLDPTAAYRRETAAVRIANARRRRKGLPALPLPQRPTGTPYVKRFRQLKKYSELPKTDPRAAARAWRDSSGVVRQYVDQRGVAYVTEAGRALLVRRKSLQHTPGRPPELRPNGTLIDLRRRLVRVRHLVSMRLRRAAGETSKAVENSDWKSTAPPASAPALA